MKAEIRIPTTQYGYINLFLEGTDADEAIRIHNESIELYKDSLETPTKTSSLTPITFLRLLYKPICNQGLQFEEIESLGTEKIYSQKDVLKIIQSLINKSKRVVSGMRADSKNYQQTITRD